MFTWVLIVLFVNPHGATSVSQEFVSEQTCKVAGAKIKNEWVGFGDEHYTWYGRTAVKVTCVQK